MNSSNSLGKQQINEIHKEHMEVFKKIDHFLDELSLKLKKQVQIMEAAKLEEYKDELIKTKGQFEEMNEKRSDNAIKKAVHAQKKAIEKECASFLQKSQQMNKVYEGLKEKLVSMSSTEQELQHEIKYLYRQIKNETSKNQYLSKELQALQEWNIKNKQEKLKKTNQISVLGQKRTNELNSPKNKFAKDLKQIQKIQSRAQRWKQNSEQRLRDKIENTKQFLNSLIFQQSTIQKLFQAYDPKQYTQDKRKITLIQSIFSQPKVKQKLYYLLFKSSRK